MANLTTLDEEPEHTIKFIEILDDAKTGQRQFFTGNLVQDQLPTWLKRPAKEIHLTTRIIFVVPLQHDTRVFRLQSIPSPAAATKQPTTSSDQPPPLNPFKHYTQGQGLSKPALTSRKSTFQPTPISERVQQTIDESLCLPRAYSRILHRGLGASLKFATPTCSEGFVLQCRPVGAWHFSLSAMIHPPPLPSHVFVYGLLEHEFLALAGALEEPEYLQISAHLIPALFLIGKRAENAADALRNCVVSLREIQQYLDDDTDGTHPVPVEDLNFSTRNTFAKDDNWLFGLDLKKTTARITHLSSELAFHKAESRVGLAMLKILKSTCSKTAKTLETRAPDSTLLAACYTDMMIVQELESYFHSMDTEAERYARSADAQRETVYALIAQKDNMLNMQGTKASLRAAESSREESNAMKLIAQSTAQDSASMSVITIITVVFLPGTFTATFFSTSFFNFQPTGSGSGRHVSPWLGLYWCITIALTLFTLFIWWFFARRRQQRIEKSLARTSGDLFSTQTVAPTVQPRPLRPLLSQPYNWASLAGDE